MSYMALYIVSMHIINSNSRSSTGSNHWKLNVDEGKVIQAHSDDSENKITNDDTNMMQILTTKQSSSGEWTVSDHNAYNRPCETVVVEKNLKTDHVVTEKQNNQIANDHNSSTRYSINWSITPLYMVLFVLAWLYYFNVCIPGLRHGSLRSEDSKVNNQCL